jgi:mannose-1-phosphate guanylyltransferase / mannose-6-phosphate isomerase
MLVPVVLAGGYGERLWPLSTPELPKPFALRDGRGLSLFQATILRVADRSLFAPPLVVCNAKHHAVVVEQLETIGCTDACLMLEPESRNTAPAIALAALHVHATAPEHAMVILPADHAIEEPNPWLQALNVAEQISRDGRMVAFAITPTAPNTAYGYIERGAAIAGVDGAYAITAFIEKPTAAVAATLLRDGACGWNSGMFVMGAAAALAQYELHAPEMLAACRAAYAQCRRAGDALWLDGASYQAIAPLAFDRAIMERTAHGAVIPLAMGWRDLGSWAALHEVAAKDSNGNAVTGTATLEDSSGCYVHSAGPAIHVRGLKDIRVVATPADVLVEPMARAAELNPVLTHAERGIGTTHRPWGWFQVIEVGAHYQVKRLTLRPGGKISLQRHTQRCEHWVVISGCATVTRGGAVHTLRENESTFIPAGEVHRLENRSDTPLVVIEVQTGSYLGEDDIERLDDCYARAPGT